ncbi:hypothetical protein QR98_0001670 [Sarcoptes scabiei]|uniref:Uncharacterized protein n=1 Tax=Sarcoptes scabiei TaxID=52283 RepID=A0A131ZSQ7_SARSC|nr:hypothetical protein QR98_0001670 [Sarcoptes scabiei]
MAFRTVSRACVNSLTKIESLKIYIEAKKLKFDHHQQMTSITTENIDDYIRELKENKLRETVLQTNNNFRLFFKEDIPKYIQTNYYTTQFFTGHGPFNEYSAKRETHSQLSMPIRQLFNTKSIASPYPLQ